MFVSRMQNRSVLLFVAHYEKKTSLTAETSNALISGFVVKILYRRVVSQL
jgi:hypothetical protein